MIKIGIIGLSPGNGHPFSFAAITNGYDEAGFAVAGWPVIHDYLRQQPEAAFTFGDKDGFDVPIRITHAWTQETDVTQALCRACRVENAVDSFEDMVDAVDAIIIARDDWEQHRYFAAPFLEKGLPVFVDKPLSLDPDDLAYFRPFLESGKLMSSSGFRYARELDKVSDFLSMNGPLCHISATVLLGLDKYGIHMLDAVTGLRGELPVFIRRLDAKHEAWHLVYGDGVTLDLNCLGNVAKTFHLSFFAAGGHYHVNLHNNFAAFRRTLALFYRQVITGISQIPPRDVLGTMDLIRQARSLTPGESWRRKNG